MRISKSKLRVSVKLAVSFFVDNLFLFVSAKSAGGGASPTGVPHSLIVGSRLRQIRVLPRKRTLCRSVVCAGIVQVRVTLSPLRAARRSLGGLGNSSEGGKGGPIDAQPVSQSKALAANKSCPGRSLIPVEEYITQEWNFEGST